MSVARTSAGLVFYRRVEQDVQVLLGHMGGPYWQRKDAGAWTIPKGEFDINAENGLAAARREFKEEIGFDPEGEFRALGSVTQKSGKIIHAWSIEGDFDPSALVSNTFDLEWPPRSGKIRQFPELDRVAWFTLSEARLKAISGQAALFDRLLATIA